MAFRDLLTTRKGEIGENIVEQYLRDQGFQTYKSTDLDNSHTTDFLGIRRGKVMVCDAKAKPLRVNRCDTGIDLVHWHRYKALGEAHGMRVFIFFVDEDLGLVYGNFLDVLDCIHLHKSMKTGARVLPAYPLTENNGKDEIRYYEYCDMLQLAKLTPQQIAELKSLSTRDPKYQAIAEERQRAPKFL
jgi:hypothetical protein